MAITVSRPKLNFPLRPTNAARVGFLFRDRAREHFPDGTHPGLLPRMKWTGFTGLGIRRGHLPAFNPQNPVNPV
jgi:hypothetical protein